MCPPPPTERARAHLGASDDGKFHRSTCAGMRQRGTVGAGDEVGHEEGGRERGESSATHAHLHAHLRPGEKAAEIWEKNPGMGVIHTL